MHAATRPPVPAVIAQHAEDAAMLRNTRSYLVRGPHVKLHQLRRLDDRLAAHLDGLALARNYGTLLVRAALEKPGSGEVFVATVRAIEDRDVRGLDKVLALAEASPASRGGAISAFGWVSAASLRGITRALLDSPNEFRREVGFATCAMHHVDLGVEADGAYCDVNASLRARALRAAASRGQLRFLPACLKSLPDDDARCAFEAARAAALLGDRRAAIAALEHIIATPSPFRVAAMFLGLMLQASDATRARLQSLSLEPSNERNLVRGIGIAGDPQYVPWLIQQMAVSKLSRGAGESFSLLTGLDLSFLDLDRKPPESIDTGPDDDPENEEVAMDEDEGLPWPDPEKVGAWWQTNGHRFASGTRYFMGEPPSFPHCFSVLKSGFQRQRAAAATYLCLLRPGTPLFNTAAPAWRQERWLNAMGA
jgi:uncharacterized protein (TIGR02270 family)